MNILISAGIGEQSDPKKKKKKETNISTFEINILHFCIN